MCVLMVFGRGGGMCECMRKRGVQEEEGGFLFYKG